MTALRPTEGLAAAALFPGSPAVGLLDARAEEPAWADVFPRPWAAGGAVLVPLAGPPPEGPFVALLPAGQVSERARAALKAAGERPFAVLADAGDGLLLRYGVPVPAVPARVQPPVRLELRGVESVLFPALNLPAAVRVTVPPADSQRFLHVSGTHPSGSLPADAWFFLDAPAGPVELEVTVVPGRGEDRWCVRAGGREVGRPSEPPTPTPTRHVILVFDRTCPDADQWVAARAMVRGAPPADLADPTATFVANRPAPDAATVSAPPPRQPSQADLNAAIRAGVEEGFRRGFGPQVEVDLVWFADTPGHMGRPPGLWIPHEACGRADYRCPAPELGRALGAATYVPGLDLWDALEDAVREAVRLVAAFGPAPVLIVGNSPPCPPTDPDHPFTRLWRARLPRSTVRSRGRFPDALDELARAGCPILVVFPVGHKLPDRGADGFSTVQAGVREAFARTMPLIQSVADREGMARGVEEAARRLNGWVSGVTVHRGAE
jgi:hypothetical protein